MKVKDVDLTVKLTVKVEVKDAVARESFRIANFSCVFLKILSIAKEKKKKSGVDSTKNVDSRAPSTPQQHDEVSRFFFFISRKPAPRGDDTPQREAIARWRDHARPWHPHPPPPRPPHRRDLLRGEPPDHDDFIQGS